MMQLLDDAHTSTKRIKTLFIPLLILVIEFSPLERVRDEWDWLFFADRWRFAYRFPRTLMEPCSKLFGSPLANPASDFFAVQMPTASVVVYRSARVPNKYRHPNVES